MEKIEKKLKGLTCLKETIKVYIPSTVNVDGTISEDKQGYYVREAMTMFSELFGGSTAYDAVGAWVSQEKGLVTEKVTIVYSFCDSLDNVAIDNILSFADWLKSELQQEAVSLEINNKLYFV